MFAFIFQVGTKYSFIRYLVDDKSWYIQDWLHTKLHILQIIFDYTASLITVSCIFHLSIPDGRDKEGHTNLDCYGYFGFDIGWCLWSNIGVRRDSWQGLGLHRHNYM